MTAINDAARTHFNRTLSYDGLDRMTGFFSSAISFGGQYNFGYDPLVDLRGLRHWFCATALDRSVSTSIS